MLVLCVNVIRLKVEIDTTRQTLPYTLYIHCLLDIIPKLTHLEISITQSILFREGFQMSRFLKELGTMIGFTPRPASIASSAPMIWEWLARGETLRTEESTSLDFGHITCTEMVGWMLLDRYEFMLETHRLIGLHYPVDAIDLDVRDDELAGMDELFDVEYGTKILAPNGLVVERESGDVVATTGPTQDDEDGTVDFGQHGDTSSSGHFNSRPQPDGDDDDDINQQSADNDEEQGPSESGEDDARESGSEDGDDASEGRESEGQSAGEEDAEMSEQDDASDEDFLEEEPSGSEWGKVDDDGDD